MNSYYNIRISIKFLHVCVSETKEKFDWRSTAAKSLTRHGETEGRKRGIVLSRAGGNAGQVEAAGVVT